MSQRSFASAEYAMKKKRTRRKVFLAEMERVVPCSRLVTVIEPLYPTSGRVGRQPVGVSRMLRMYCLQQWYSLADEALEDALYDSQAMRDFVGIDLSRESVPDATTLLKFRRLLLANDLTKDLFDEINAHLAEQGLLMRAGVHRGRHHHRGAEFDQERGQRTRPGDAPDQKGQRLALRHEGAHRRGCQLGSGSHDGWHGGQRERRDAGRCVAAWR
jgi:transposase